MVDSLVNAATIAAKLGQAKSSIYRLAQAGLIPSYAAGPCLRGKRFDIVEVRDALKALAQRPAIGRSNGYLGLGRIPLRSNS